MNELYKKVKCPDCCWSELKDEAAMTPCPECNSTGYIYEPADVSALISEARKEERENTLRYIEITFSNDITLRQMMATNTWQSLTKEGGGE